MNIQEAIDVFERWAKPSFAVEGDRIGLQIGDSSRKLTGILVTLDVTKDVVAEAVQCGANLIIAHHPFIFQPIKNVHTSTYRGGLLASLLANDLSVYVAHTNLDIVQGGVNDMMAEALGLINSQVLVSTKTEALHKLIVYTPETHSEAVHQAMGQAGAGSLGHYRDCAFSTKGIGMFRPDKEATPYLGKEGVLERVDEIRLEVVVEEGDIENVLTAARQVHPYEEMAYDLIRMDIPGKEYGLGRIGTLPAPMTLKSFADLVKKSFDVPFVRIIGNEDQPVERVAVLGGDGNKYVSAAQKQGADVFVTGDLYFHIAQDAMYEGLMLIDPGHHAEKIMKQGVVDVLRKKLPHVKMYASQLSSEPFKLG
ncbi:Nif3-like dinuclear metal center hexameric protein [Bacillaceae bacterium SIJ1]|uniref:Nif3-like dinuclear metal center hexameric protein n=1 Tax=Litoribacterium kuwaitense TaxID=1398745 RepID=UPI0013EAEDA5|nr:Nif3-like dinuclear metal center hexameric protein [Litoribacterium kuwaitense]NGP43536.1 Nif3-like dinuclear metal center hexameric protein [Litoribacterium kuwaitense]